MKQHPRSIRIHFNNKILITMSSFIQRIQQASVVKNRALRSLGLVSNPFNKTPYTQWHSDPFTRPDIISKKSTKHRFFSRRASIGQQKHCIAASDSIIEVDIAVDGMVCDGCTSRVEEGLEKMDIVESAKADLEAKKVTVALTAESFGEAAQQLERVVEAVNDMGFEAKPTL